MAVPIVEDELAELVGWFPRAKVFLEGGKEYVLIPQARLPEFGTERALDLLLCPTERDGYPSRLFLEAQVAAGPQRPWLPYHILDRQWWAYSWRVDAGPQRLLQLVQLHARALR